MTMDTYAAVIDEVPPLDVKDLEGTDKWKDWLDLFNQKANISSFSGLSEYDKVQLFLSRIGKDAVDIFFIVYSSQVNVHSLTFKEAVKCFDTYFRPAVMRHYFLCVQQDKDDSFDKFAKKVELLSKPCRFEPFRETLERDVFIRNMHPQHVNIRKDMLKTIVNPSLEETVKIAVSLLSTKKQTGSSNKRWMEPKVLSLKRPDIATEELVEVEVLCADNTHIFVSPTIWAESRQQFQNEFNAALKKSDKLTFTEPAPEEKKKYAAYCKNKWHRVVILSLSTNELAEVQSLDFGWKSTVPFTSIKNFNKLLDFVVVPPFVVQISVQASNVSHVKVDEKIEIRLVGKCKAPNFDLWDVKPVCSEHKRVPHPLKDAEDHQRRNNVDFSQQKTVPSGRGNDRNNRSRRSEGNETKTSLNSQKNEVSKVDRFYNRGGQSREKEDFQKRSTDGRSTRNNYSNEPEFSRDQPKADSRYSTAERGETRITNNWNKERDNTFEKKGNDNKSTGKGSRDINFGNNTSVNFSDNRNENENYRGSRSFTFNGDRQNHNYPGSRDNSDRRAGSQFRKSLPTDRTKNVCPLQASRDNFKPRTSWEQNGNDGNGVSDEPYSGNDDRHSKRPIETASIKTWTSQKSGLSEGKKGDGQIDLDSHNSISTVNADDLAEQMDNLSLDDVTSPIPKNVFTSVMVVNYEGPEKEVSVCPESKRELLSDIAKKMAIEFGDCSKNKVIQSPAVGSICAAPFEKGWYRSKILVVNNTKQCATVVFLDFGNKGEVELSELLHLPPVLQDIERFTFNIKLPSDVKLDEEETFQIIKIRPVSMISSGAWLVDVRDLAEKDAEPSPPKDSQDNCGGGAGKAHRKSDPGHVEISYNERASGNRRRGNQREPFGEPNTCKDRQTNSSSGSDKASRRSDSGPAEPSDNDGISGPRSYDRKSFGEPYIIKDRQNHFEGGASKTPRRSDPGPAETLENNRASGSQNRSHRMSGGNDEGRFRSNRCNNEYQSNIDEQTREEKRVGQGIGNTSNITRNDIAQQLNNRSTANINFDPPPVPVGLFTPVIVITDEKSKDIFVYPKSKSHQLFEITRELEIEFEDVSKHRTIQRPSVGLICAVLFEGGWYRAEIIAITNTKQRAKVFLIDFGKRAAVDYSQLLQLPPQMQNIERSLFQIEPTSNLNLGDDYDKESVIEIKPVNKNPNGAWLVEVKGDSLRKQAASFDDPAQQIHNTSIIDVPPIPMDSFTSVMVMHNEGPGKVFVCQESRSSELTDMLVNLASEFGYECKSKIIPRLTIGLVCAAPFDEGWYRAKILTVNNLKRCARVVFFDFGNESDVDFSQLMHLSSQLQEVECLSFRISLPSTFTLDDTNNLEVKPVSMKNGSWIVQVKGVDDIASDSEGAVGGSTDITLHQEKSASSDLPTNVNSRPSTGNSTKLRSPHPPPIPKDSFTSVRIVYINKERIFAIPYDKLDELEVVGPGNLAFAKEARCCEVVKTGQLVIAPFESDWCRGKVTEVDEMQGLIQVFFVDYGNEELLGLEELRPIPQELADVPRYLFEIRFHPRSEIVASAGADLSVSALSRNPDGSWLVQVEGEPAYGNDQFPDLSDASDEMRQEMSPTGFCQPGHKTNRRPN